MIISWRDQKCSYHYKLEGPGKYLTKNDGWIVMSYLPVAQKLHNGTG